MNELEKDKTLLVNQGKTIFVFTNNGQVFKFSGVKNFTNTTTGFEFDYFGKASKTKNHAIFNNTSVAGYSIKNG